MRGGYGFAVSSNTNLGIILCKGIPFFLFKLVQQLTQISKFSPYILKEEEIVESMVMSRVSNI